MAIPDALRESVTIDGANDLIAFRIYLPLCTPVLATVALFYGLDYWNDWWNAIMLVDNKALYPLQYLLFALKSQISMLNELKTLSGGDQDVTLPSESIKMAQLMLPLVQSYYCILICRSAVYG